MAGKDTLRREHLHLEDLAEELTRRLGIPFRATERRTITFRDRLRITDWAVPLMFDGHAARDDDAIIPTDFVGHLLWPTLHPTWTGRHERAWWYCTLTAPVAEALLEALRENDDHPLDEDAWVIGEDVELDELYTPSPRRRRVA